MNKIILSLLLLSFSFKCFSQDKINLIASIKPLQLVAQELLGDLGNTSVLIPAGASPHHYSLKPSDMRELAQADLVVWVGPSMEQFLAKTLHHHHGAVLQLMSNTENSHHNHGHEHQKSHQTSEKEHSSHAHHQPVKNSHEEHDGEHHHDHSGAEDLHIWLDPILMIEAANQIRAQLTKLHPELENELSQNYTRFKQQVLATDYALKKQLQPYKDRGFIVFHDAFSLFVEHYSLNQLAYFTVEPSRSPSAKKVAQLQSLIKSKNAVCVFSEPQFRTAIVKRLTAGAEVNTGTLDPLATRSTAEQGYTGFIKGLANSIEKCLK